MIKILRIPGFVRYFSPYRTWNFSFQSKTVYLTFDDGPDPQVTSWVLDFLAKEKIKATFFCVGSNVCAYPELFKRIQREGHQVGNHSMQHQLFDPKKEDEYIQSIEEAERVIPSKLFRPPYGKLSCKISKLIAKKYKIIMWTWMAYDFDENVSIERVIRSSKNIRSGDILVFHDNLKSEFRLKHLLPEVVKVLKNKGYQFSTIHN